MERIARMDAGSAARISGGQVVTTLGAAIKELLENALVRIRADRCRAGRPLRRQYPLPALHTRT